MASGIDPLSSVDTAWLRMDEPANRMVISVLITLKSPLSRDELVAMVKERWLVFDRFRSRVVETRLPWCPAYWDSPCALAEVDLAHHVVEHVLSGDLDSPETPAGKPALESLCGEVCSEGLDRERPLWRMHLVQGFEDRSALVVRVHHCVSDGTGLVYVLGCLGNPDLLPPKSANATTAESSKKTGGWRLGRAFASKTRATGRAVKIWFGRSEKKRIAGATATLTRMSKDPNTRFKGPLGIPKATTWGAEPISLAAVKSVSKATGATVNDVLVTALTGSLRRYLHAAGDPVNEISFRAAVPVDLKQGAERMTLGNKFGVVFLELPIDRASPAERLRAVHERMMAHKTSAEADAILGILNTVGVMPKTVQNTVIGAFSSKATTVMTNIRGPAQPVYFGPAEIEGLMVWVPQTGRLSLGISMMSYNGNVWLGFVSDRGRIPDPEKLVDGFYAEFELLRALV